MDDKQKKTKFEKNDKNCDKKSLEPSNDSSTQDGDQKKNLIYVVEKWDEEHIALLRMSKVNSKRNIGFKKEMVIKFLQPLVPSNIYIPRKMKFIAYVGFQNETELLQVLGKKNLLIKDTKIKISKFHRKPSKTPVKGVPWHPAVAKPVTETAKIFVRNLSYTITEEDLREFFGKIGPIRGLSLPICKETSKQKGFALIGFMLPEHAVEALNLDGTELQGRRMHILPSNLDEDEEIKNLTFQEKKEKKTIASSNSWQNWNMLFLGSNAVMNILANNNAMTKMQMLENDDGNFAVNMAMEETNIVRDTKQFLEDNGVCLDSFSNPGLERSSTVILAKNLPTNTTAEEIQDRFGKFGDLNRVLLPEHGLTAIIEFVHGDHAATAFKKLAYKRFKYLPFLLEWAPIQIFKKDNSTNKQEDNEIISNNNTKSEDNEIKSENNTTPEDNKIKSKNNKRNIEQNEAITELQDVILEQQMEPEQNATLYVKNINFSTTEETLKEFFSSGGKVYTTLLAKEKKLSKGYGFVQYYKRSDAKKAHLKFQNSVLDEHSLIVEMSQKILSNQTSVRRNKLDPAKQKSSKIMVKNIPFQATSTEIRKIFKPFGLLRAIRLPLKCGESSENRGFCFIEFSSIEDAERAFGELSTSTHLYGRRLVLQWAKEDESLEELIQKTAQNFMAMGPSRKKLKLDNNDDEYKDIM